MTPWEIALKHLLRLAHRSPSTTAGQGRGRSSAFSQWQRSRWGVDIETLDRLLMDLGLSWDDWVQAFEEAQATYRKVTEDRRPFSHVQKHHPLIKQDREMKARLLRQSRMARHP
jgi:hypothetical protein